MMKRIGGWENKLFLLVKEASERTYVLGEHDCTTFALDVIFALTGEDFGKFVRKKYETRAESLRIARNIGGKGLKEAATKILEREPRDWAMAMRGDLVVVLHESIEHFGVCLGSVAAMLGDEGLIYIPMNRCTSCWNI